MAAKRAGVGEFRAGDLVELKSGSPPMTVMSTSPDSDGEVRVFCTWFAGKKNEKAHFVSSALVLHVPKKDGEDGEE